MSVLLLQLAGPLQAWGSAARFARRTTESAPTKSGVIGLLAAAEGRDRSAELSDLAALRFGVRVDERGTRVRDYQTAQHQVTGTSMPVSERFYLSDAVFVAAVEGDDDLVSGLFRALRAPVYLPYLGRRSCPPARPLDLRVRTDADLETALREEAWLAAGWHQRRRRAEEFVSLDVHIEATAGLREADLIRDNPVSFDPLHRRYDLRGVCTHTVLVRNPCARRESLPEHDPTIALGGA